MLKEKAGEVAGEIWNALNEHGDLTFTALKKVTKETNDNLYLGIGWLLREGKISNKTGRFYLE